VGTLGLQSPKIQGKSKLTFDMREKYVFSKKKNVIVLVLDTFQSDAFQEIMNQEPNYGKIFRDFTYFRNNLGGYTGTFFSVPLILTGQYYWDQSQSIKEYTKKAYLSCSLPYILKNSGFHVGLYPLQFPDILFSKEIASNFVSKKAVKSAEMAFLLDLALFRQLPQFLKKKVYNNQKWFLCRYFDDPHVSRPGKKRKPRLRKKTYMDLNKDQENIELFEASMTLIGRPVFKYWHWRGLHPPLARKENCEYARLEFTRFNYIGQAKCVLRLVDRFLAKLKEAEIYDNSMIVVVGDHGVRMENIGILYEKKPDCWQLDNGSDTPIIIRQAAIPLLLVKKFAIVQAEMKVSDSPAVLADIPRTVFAEMGIQTAVPGVSLFSLAESQRRIRPFYLVSGSLQSGVRLKKILIDGFSWRPEPWRALFGESNLDMAED